MDLRLGYDLRAATWDDLESAAEVLAVDDLDDGGRVVLDIGFLRGQWERPGFDLASDAWVAVGATGTVVGYGQVTHDEIDVVASWAVVHPEHRGRGIGSTLLERIEARAAVMASGVPGARFRHAVNAGDEAAAALLTGRGLRLVRHFWHMGAELPAEVAPGAAPAGITITPLRAPAEVREVHAVLDEAFADHWDHHSEPFERWAEDLTGGPDYDPLLWRLARDGGDEGRLVGALTAGVLDESGWVTVLGVRADARGRGIALALLRHAFAGFAGRGIRSILLVVDAANSTGATRLYERAGMRVAKRFDLWERSLSGPAAR